MIENRHIGHECSLAQRDVGSPQMMENRHNTLIGSFTGNDAGSPQMMENRHPSTGKHLYLQCFARFWSSCKTLTDRVYLQGILLCFCPPGEQTPDALH